MADDNRRDGMQRLRVGLTGLAVVLIIVALATALFNAIDDQVVENDATPAIEAGAEPKNEPLADLGMVPGAPIENLTKAQVQAETQVDGATAKKLP